MMLCDLCNINPATVHIQEVIGESQKAVHLCQQCASDQNALANGEDGLKLAALICKMASKQLELGTSDAQEADADEGTVCPGCGMSESEYREGGRLGCGDCYDAFVDTIQPMLRDVHRGCEHRGKPPGARAENAKPAAHTEPAIGEIEAELAQAIAEEQYERAAELRDALLARNEHACDV